jgi:hypothetical protein
VLSEVSVQGSWVEKGHQAGFEEDWQHKTTVLFPTRLDDTVMEADEAWARDIRGTRHMGDFLKWKDDGSYKKA